MNLFDKAMKYAIGLGASTFLLISALTAYHHSLSKALYPIASALCLTIMYKLIKLGENGEASE